jgi:L-fuculose-phosphate aldolase
MTDTANVTMPPDEAKLRKLICKIGKLMRRYGYIDGGSGNISTRLDAERFLITPSGIGKGYMKPDQLIVIDMDGKKVAPETVANRNMRASSETAMHLEAYRQRSDVQGVVHAHPPTAVALTLAGVTLAQCVVPEAIVMMGLVPTTPYATPSSTENSDAIRAVIPSHDVLMLSHHGSLTVGPDVWTAYLLLETLEHYANILYKAHLLGGPRPLLPDQISKLLDIRERMGLMRVDDEEQFKKFLEP